MIDYSYFYKEKLTATSNWSIFQWDCFISVWTDEERTQSLFSKVNCAHKFLLKMPEHNIQTQNICDTTPFSYDEAKNEAEYILHFWEQLKHIPPNAYICIDATGFLPHYLMYLIKFLKLKNFIKFDILYSEPNYYIGNENTKFTDDHVIKVRQIYGYEGNHIPETSEDLLIINSGYDYKLISNAAEHKNHAKKVQLFGFPPLRADMYQENILRAQRAEEAVGELSLKTTHSLLAPAHDPFTTANVLSEYIKKFNSKKPFTNLYLCPLGTKPQLIGMVLLFLYEFDQDAASIIFPFCQKYYSDSSVGLTNVWRYTIEFPTF